MEFKKIFFKVTYKILKKKKKSEIFKDQKTQRSLEGKCYHYGKIIPPLIPTMTIHKFYSLKRKHEKARKQGKRERGRQDKFYSDDSDRSRTNLLPKIPENTG